MKYERLTDKDWHTTKTLDEKDDFVTKRAKLCKLWDLENKIENGTLVELPCKVGSAIYLIYKEQWSVGKKETYWYIRKTKLTYGNMERVVKEYGDFVFLTKAEAEAKLKELLGE